MDRRPYFPILGNLVFREIISNIAPIDLSVITENGGAMIERDDGVNLVAWLFVSPNYLSWTTPSKQQ
ncbi:hypothetical protein L3Y34_009294 [Caenorhabditis briggsae]|uniref:Uncharacterized protein n=1 Tax=Caenorhabditis briggsae TaxID=6238 RepID=A0AAE9A5G5_CAEBR|nr:hypothetical protein L3Y34_009294 [Caenorhabditis briggsae]